MINQRAWASAALIFLAGCGGGSEESSSTTAPAATAPAAAVSQLRTALSARAIAAAAASPAQAAEQLLDHAEASFPALFPSHQTTATLDPFVFRYYPQTGIYVGVVVKGGMGYPLDSVYVMGGPFGATAVHVGQLSDFITPVDPGTGPGGPALRNNGCYDLALLGTTGTRIERTIQSVGSSTGVVTEVLTIHDERMFDGHMAVQTQVRRTGALTGASSTTRVDSEENRYEKRTSESEVARYGFESANYVSNEHRIVRTPSATEQRYGLAIGQSVVQSVTGTATTSLPNATGKPQTTTIARRETVRFVGREQVTTPSNTYSTCKFETTYSDQDGTNADLMEEIWVIEGKGIVVKMQLYFKGRRFATDQATSVKLNGQSL